MRTSGIPGNTDEYIAGFPENIQRMLNDLRAVIKKAAPDAEESISYRMPAYKLNGVLVYFAAQTRHIGFYPTSSGVKAFMHELGSYKTSKGAIQFPIDKPLPLELITKIVQFRAKENSDLLKSAKEKK
jgi:uncharacterized protein YdhG (YjbR/CyaY superfamily)